jgi:thiol-disulfide isomerase/thioredoxin
MNSNNFHKAGYIALGAITIGFVFFLIFINQYQSISPHKLLTLEGKVLQIPSHEKKLTWVNFWSISCPPCIQEMPLLEDMHQKYKLSNHVKIVTIAMNYDAPHLLKEVQSRLKLSIPIGLDLDGNVAKDFSKNMPIPSHYLVDKEGYILYSHIGSVNKQQIEQTLLQFL